MTSRPSSPRTAKPRPSPAISTSGRGAHAAQITAATTAAAPLQRSGVLNKPMTRKPAVASNNGPVPNRGTRPYGQARNPQADGIHPFDAVAHLPPEFGVETERHGENAEDSHRHDPGRDDRHGKEIGNDAIGRDAVEVEGCVRRRRQAREQRSNRQTDDLVDAPQRRPRTERGVGAPAQLDRAALITG